MLLCRNTALLVYRGRLHSAMFRSIANEMPNVSFDRFSERTRHVIVLATDEAQQYHHSYIGTEHLLLGLLRETDGVAATVLRALGLEVGKVRAAVEFIVGAGENGASHEIDLTPRAEKVIELAVAEARQLRHHYIGTEHLLLGMVQEGESVAVGVLESLGVNLSKVRMRVTEVLTK